MPKIKSKSDVLWISFRAASKKPLLKKIKEASEKYNKENPYSTKTLTEFCANLMIDAITMREKAVKA